MNALPALCSLLVPGLGQLIQGRLIAAMFFFVLAIVGLSLTGGIANIFVGIWACLNAANHRTAAERKANPMRSFRLFRR